MTPILRNRHFPGQKPGQIFSETGQNGHFAMPKAGHAEGYITTLYPRMSGLWRRCPVDFSLRTTDRLKSALDIRGYAAKLIKGGVRLNPVSSKGDDADIPGNVALASDNLINGRSVISVFATTELQGNSEDWASFWNNNVVERDRERQPLSGCALLGPLQQISAVFGRPSLRQLSGSFFRIGRSPIRALRCRLSAFNGELLGVYGLFAGVISPTAALRRALPTIGLEVVTTPALPRKCRYRLLNVAVAACFVFHNAT